MAISNLAQLAAAAKQTVDIHYNTGRTANIGWWITPFGQLSNIATGTLGGTSTTTGVVPTDATAGFPTIYPFDVGAKGYLTGVNVHHHSACRVKLFDLLWKAGSYSFNANTSGNTPASYASRVPGGDYKGLQIWVECVTATTGNLSVNVTYINQDGTAGRTTGTVNLGTLPIGRIVQVPLASGDSGVQGITGVVGSVATAGTFNLLVLRPLWQGRLDYPQMTLQQGADYTMLPQVFEDSALYWALVMENNANTGQPVFEAVIAHG